MSCSCPIHIDDQLIHSIKFLQNTRVKSILKKNKNLANASDCRGTLLHHAAAAYNKEIARFLIALGSPINHPNQDGKTPLMLAVEHDRDSTVKLLLKAGADINAVDARGESALYKALHLELYFDTVEAILLQARVETPKIEDLVEKLLRAECSFAHAAVFRDVELLENLLRRGFDVNARDPPRQRTALHYAALTNKLEVTKYLVDRGADVNARDDQTIGPLYYAAGKANLALMQLLLDHGAEADPDVDLDAIPLYACLMARGSDERVSKCVELLVQYGGCPRESHTLVLQVLDMDRYDVLKGSRLFSLVAHQAILDEQIQKNVEQQNRNEEEKEKHLTEFVELKEYYDNCCQILKTTVVVGTTTLLDLLHGCSESQMTLNARNPTFVSLVKDLCLRSSMKQHFPYYANNLKKLILKATRRVKLEDKAILRICKIFQCHINQLTIIARQVVGYLSEPDLERLCRV